MGPIAVVVAAELRQHRAEVPLAEHDEVIQTFPPEGADDPLGDRVRLGGMDRREHGLDAQPARPLPEVAAVTTGLDEAHAPARAAYARAGFAVGAPSVTLYRDLEPA